MKAIESPWPFVLDHITDNDERLKGVGLLPKAYIQGLVSAMSAELHHPCMIAEFPLFDTDKPCSELPPPVEQRSRGKNGDVNPACLCFKNLLLNAPMQLCGQTVTIGRECCDFVDARLFNLFRNLRDNQLTEEVIRARVYEHDCFSSLQGEKHFTCGVKMEEIDNVEKAKTYFEFECTWFPYLCIIVPIVFEGKVLGIQSVGQIIRDDKLPLFDDAFRQAEERLGTKMPLVIQEHRRRVAPVPNEVGVLEKASCILSQQDYHRLIQSAVRNALELESTLTREMRFLRERYASERMRSYHRLLSETITVTIGNKAPEESLFEQFWDLVNAVIQRIVDDFKLEFSVIFGTNTFQPKTDSIMPSVITVGRLPDMYAELYRTGKLDFDLSHLPQDDLNKLLKSNKRGDLFRCIHGGEMLDPQANFIRLTPAPLATSSTVVTWVGYNDTWNPLDTCKPYYAESGKIVEHEILSLYAVIVAAHAAIQAEIASENILRQRRIFGHEVSQLAGGLDWIGYALSDPEGFRARANESIRRASRDIYAFCELSQLLAESAKYFVEDLELTTELIEEPFGALLYKWHDTFRIKANAKKLSIHARWWRDNDPLPPRLVADKKLMNQLLYNLVTNAVKYCHRGTIIHLDCRERQVAERQYHMFSVTDYGIAFDVDRPFQYGARGEAVKTMQMEGLGIGLFLADKIARAHGGWIERESVEVSKYNIPLVESGAKLDLEAKGVRKQELSAELSRLRDSGLYDEVVAMKFAGTSDETGEPLYHKGMPLFDNPTFLEIQYAIGQPTYRVTINTFIPSTRG